MVMMKSKLTSVKILENLYKRFKSTTVNTKMTLQKLTNRSIDLYLTDEQYKQKLEEYDNLTISGSNL
jgi:predicted house-cleaning NTP pyrophosphatase (Maf/HAM1 superfamily)